MRTLLIPQTELPECMRRSSLLQRLLYETSLRIMTASFSYATTEFSESVLTTSFHLKCGHILVISLTRESWDYRNLHACLNFIVHGQFCKRSIPLRWRPISFIVRKLVGQLASLLPSTGVCNVA